MNTGASMTQILLVDSTLVIYKTFNQLSRTVLTDGLTEGTRWAVESGQTALEFIGDAFKWFANVLKTIWQKLGDFMEWLVGAAKFIWKEVVVAGWDLFIKATKTIWQKCVVDVAEWFVKAIKTVWNDGIVEMWDWFINTFKTIWQKGVVDVANWMAKSIKTVWNDVVVVMAKWFVKAVKTVWHKVIKDSFWWSVEAVKTLWSKGFAGLNSFIITAQDKLWNDGAKGFVWETLLQKIGAWWFNGLRAKYAEPTDAVADVRRLLANATDMSLTNVTEISPTDATACDSYCSTAYGLMIAFCTGIALFMVLMAVKAFYKNEFEGMGGDWVAGGCAMLAFVGSFGILSSILIFLICVVLWAAILVAAVVAAVLYAIGIVGLIAVSALGMALFLCIGACLFILAALLFALMFVVGALIIIVVVVVAVVTLVAIFLVVLLSMFVAGVAMAVAMLVSLVGMLAFCILSALVVGVLFMAVICILVIATLLSAIALLVLLIVFGLLFIIAAVVSFVFIVFFMAGFCVFGVVAAAFIVLGGGLLYVVVMAATIFFGIFALAVVLGIGAAGLLGCVLLITLIIGSLSSIIGICTAWLGTLVLWFITYLGDQRIDEKLEEYTPKMCQPTKRQSAKNTTYWFSAMSVIGFSALEILILVPLSYLWQITISVANVSIIVRDGEGCGGNYVNYTHTSDGMDGWEAFEMPEWSPVEFDKATIYGYLAKKGLIPYREIPFFDNAYQMLTEVSILFSDFFILNWECAGTSTLFLTLMWSGMVCVLPVVISTHFFVKLWATTELSIEEANGQMAYRTRWNFFSNLKFLLLQFLLKLVQIIAETLIRVLILFITSLTYVQYRMSQLTTCSDGDRIHLLLALIATVLTWIYIAMEMLRLLNGAKSSWMQAGLHSMSRRLKISGDYGCFACCRYIGFHSLGTTMEDKVLNTPVVVVTDLLDTGAKEGNTEAGDIRQLHPRERKQLNRKSAKLFLNRGESESALKDLYSPFSLNSQNFIGG
jgi:hypothetical protein